MSIIHFFSEGIHSNPKNELKGSFQRTMSKEFYKAGSLKGRAVCFILAPMHGVNVVAKPIFYFLLTVGNACKGAIMSGVLLANHIHLINLAPYEKRNFSDQQKKAFKNAGGCAINVIVSPLGQIAQTCKAAAGVFHPGAYFKRYEPTGSGRIQEFSYRINCDLDWPEKKPKEALKVLAEGWTHEHTLSVSYKGQQGIDAGGLQRQFISTLFESTSSEKNLQDGIARWEEKDEELYHNIGRVLKVLLHFYANDSMGLHTQSPTPIGEVFHPSHFAMLGFDYDELDLPYENLSFETVLDVLIAAADNEGQKQHLESIRDFYEWDGYGPDKKTTDYYLAVIDNMKDFDGFEFDDLIVDGSSVVKNIDVIKAQIEEQLSEYAEAKVRTLHAIAKGMKPNDRSAWERLQNRGAEPVQKYVQGEFDKERLLTKTIEFSWGISEDVQNAILERLGEKTNEELKNFLRYTTGSSVLPIVQKVSFQPCAGSSFSVHTCSMAIDLPRESSIDEILEEINFMCSGQGSVFNDR